MPWRRIQRLLPELLPAVPAVADRLAASGNGLFPAVFSIWVICRRRLFLFMLTFMLFPLCWLCVSICEYRNKGGCLLTPSSPRGLLAMRSFHPSPADRRDLTSCFDFWESDKSIRRESNSAGSVVKLTVRAKHIASTRCANVS